VHRLFLPRKKGRVGSRPRCGDSQEKLDWQKEQERGKEKGLSDSCESGKSSLTMGGRHIKPGCSARTSQKGPPPKFSVLGELLGATATWRSEAAKGHGGGKR